MSHASIISISPFETTEEKPIARGRFIIPAAEKDGFVIVIINDSSYIQRLTATNMNIQVPVAAELIARSIVDDFVLTTIEATSEAHPGMMWVPGKLTKTEVVMHHTEALDALKVKQIRWFENLCRKADDDWSQYRHHGLISDHQKYAAKYLGHEAEWLVEYNQNAGMMDCPACFSKIDARAIVCINCKAVLDRAKAISYGIIPQAPQDSARVATIAKG
jgi:hypothetical protein